MLNGWYKPIISHQFTIGLRNTTIPAPDYIIIGPKNDVLFHFFFRYELAQLLIHNNSITIVVILVYPAAASI